MCYKLSKCGLATLLPFVLLWFWAWVSTLPIIETTPVYSIALAFSLVYSVAGGALLAIYTVSHTKFD